jgi:hypothetical protein
MGLPLKQKSYREDMRRASAAFMSSDSFLTRNSVARSRSSTLLHAAHFFAQALARQSLLDPLLFARFQEKRVLLDVFDDVFLLNLALEAPQGALEGFPLIQDHFRQSFTTSFDTAGIPYRPLAMLSRSNLSGT